MFTLKNEYGSAFIEVSSEYERDELIERGFTLVEPNKPKTEKKSKNQP